MGETSLNLTDNSLQVKQAGTTLSATVSATGHFTRTFPWTINKSVTPASLNIMPGGSGTAAYTITVTKGAGVDAAFIDGQVCVTNGGAVATQNLAIVANLTMPPSSTIITSVSVDVSMHPVLASGETFCYNYRIDIPAGSIVPGGTYKVTADVTITNHSGHIGTPFGPSPSTTIILATTPTLVNDTIHVDDSNGISFPFNTSGSQTYNKIFTCEDQGTNTNTATIRETGQQSSASVTVICGCTEVFVNEIVCVQADVTITPRVVVGEIESFCAGEPIIGECPGTPARECTFMVSQNICVEVPLAFSAVATAVPTGIVCGTPEVGECEEEDLLAKVF
ncbi:MAG: hypothetical protein ABRQ24_10340 [Syntrophomonadaceae bacterium]